MAEEKHREIRQKIKEARRRKDLAEERVLQEKLYAMKPSGEILFRLIQIAKSQGDLEYEKDLLRRKQQLEPQNKKLQRRMEKVNAILEQKENPELQGYRPREKYADIEKAFIIPVSRKTFLRVQSAREIVYTTAELQEKKEQIEKILENDDEDLLLFVLAELYTTEGYRNIAQQMIKKHKRTLNAETDGIKIKLANRVFELVTSKKTRRYNWQDFWLAYKKFSDESGTIVRRQLPEEKEER